jgi:integrase
MKDAGKAARKRRLTPERARQIIESTVAEVMEETGHALPHSSIEQYFRSWMKEKENAGAETTVLRYQGIVDRFLTFLDSRAADSLTSLTKADVLAFRDELADEVTAGTVNTYLKVLRVALSRAVKEQIIERNPAALVDRLSNRDRHERRPFTLDELKKLLEVATGEWRTMILVGLYTGLRLQDIANLTWENLDLKTRELTVATGKTGRIVILPIARPLMRHIETLPAGDDPKAGICPDLEGKSSSWLSNQFFDLMASAALVTARGHQGKQKGRNKRRDLNAISFHALRHTSTSLLKNAGVSDVIARDIIGHESAAISKNYTHIEMATKREAVNKMPDIFQLVDQLKLRLGQ